MTEFAGAVELARHTVRMQREIRAEAYWCGATIVRSRGGEYAVHNADAWERPESTPLLSWSPPSGIPVADVDVNGTVTLREGS